MWKCKLHGKVLCYWLAILKCICRRDVLCISQRVYSQSSVRGRGAFTVSVVGVVVTSVGFVVSVGWHVSLWVWVTGLSRVDVTSIIMEAVEVTGVTMTSTSHERQSAALLQTPDIHSNVMILVESSNDHLFTLLFAFLPFRNFCTGLWSLQNNNVRSL